MTTAGTTRGGILLLTGLLACLAGTVLWANLWKSDLQVAEIAVRGNSIVPRQEILELASITKASKLFEVDLFAVRQRIEKNAFVRSASVNRDVPDRITIAVEERVPVAALAGAELLYVDAEGFLLPHILSAHIFDIPVLTGEVRPGGLVAGRRTTSTALRDALTLLAMARRYDDALYRRISEVHIGADGDMTLFTSEAGVRVLFGRGELPSKLAKFDAFWHAYVEHRGAAALEYVDLRFEDQVVVRWRQRSTDPSPS